MNKILKKIDQILYKKSDQFYLFNLIIFSNNNLFQKYEETMVQKL